MDPMGEKERRVAERRLAERRLAEREAAGGGGGGAGGGDGAGGAGGGRGGSGSGAFKVPSSVAGKGQVFQAQWASSLKGKNDLPPRKPMEKMVDHLMRELTGKSRPLDAWSTLFRADDVVAVKPNTLGRDWCSPSPAMVSVILERLRSVGVKPGNIYVWDRGHLAYTKLYAWLKAGKGFKGELRGVNAGLQSKFGYDPRPVKISTGQTEQLDKVIRKATAVVSVPVWKDHGIAGVTGALKNVAFGIMRRAAAYHGNACTPGIGDFYNLPEVRPKIRLILADVHRAIYEGGPFGGRRHNVWLDRVLATRDPVALDRVQWNELDRLRKANGLSHLMAGGGHGKPIHIAHAAKLGLGEPNLAKIKHTKKTLR
jgi:uncharacterized protein (DUF362 family)